MRGGEGRMARAETMQNLDKKRRVAYYKREYKSL